MAVLFATFVYVFALLSLGLLVATKAENQMQALQMSMTYILPSVFFSGFIFPRETMPWIFYALGAHSSRYLFHFAHARHHPARRALFRILAESRRPYRHVRPALLFLRAAFSEEDRLKQVWLGRMRTFLIFCVARDGGSGRDIFWRVVVYDPDARQEHRTRSVLIGRRISASRRIGC